MHTGECERKKTDFDLHCETHKHYLACMEIDMINGGKPMSYESWLEIELESIWEVLDK